MKVLILCGVFAAENENEIIKHARRPVEFSANIFQKKLINGFIESGFDCRVISAPFIGSYPNASDLRVFSGFENTQSEFDYVNFNNIWGVRNFSRAASLKQKAEPFIEDRDCQKLIVVYSPHTPFLEAAVYAKKRDSKIKICLVVPDLPQYMNLDANISMLYKLGKSFDIKKFNKLNRYVDSYVLLTEAMSEKIDISNKPYCVAEGIVDTEKLEKSKQIVSNKKGNEKYIVYTGKMNEKFGVKDLVDAFCNMKAPSYRLVMCGCGDADGYIKEKARLDSRIIATGQITPDEAAEWMLKADVLVNPRKNDEEYTKYSFPSKTIEYLLTGNPTVGYILDGMPKIYNEFIYNAEEFGLSGAIERAVNSNEAEKAQRYFCIKEYMKKLSAKSLASRIMELNFIKEDII